MTFYSQKAHAFCWKKYKLSNKNKTEPKMENPTHSFRETNLVLQLKEESQIKSKTVISWSSREEKEGIFCTIYFAQRKFY